MTVEDFHGDIQKILDIVRGNYDGCEEASGIILFVHFCPIIKLSLSRDHLKVSKISMSFDLLGKNFKVYE